MFFELEDIKRRHSLYSDIYNVSSWSPATDSSFGWNYQRGFMASVPAFMIAETFFNFFQNAKLMLKHYEPP